MIRNIKNILSNSKNKIGVFSYPIRIIVYSFVILLTYLYQEGNLSNLTILYIIVCSLIPHLGILTFIYSKKEKRTWVIAFYVLDSVLASIFIYNIELSYFASTTIIITIFSSSIALRGLKFTFKTFLTFIACFILMYFIEPFELKFHTSTLFNQISSFFITFYIITFSISGYLFTRNVTIIKNRIIEQNQLISEKVEEVEKQSSLINDQLKYTQKVQEIMLPSESLFKKYFLDFFIYYKPVHHVGGDFYWLKKTDEFTFLLCVDCTGHGVPGGFMSMIAYQLLEETIFEKRIYDTCLIFKEIHKELNIRLRQDNTQNTDGMAISLVRFEKGSRNVTIAGSYQPVIVYSNGKFKEIKTTRKQIGGILINRKRSFENFKVELEPNSTIYLFSDGVTDQLNKESTKKIGYRRIFKSIKENAHLSFNDQKNNIEKTINEWKGEFEQTDDLTFLAVKY